MKYLAILVMFVIFLAPITAFAQLSEIDIILEPIPDSTDMSVTIEGELFNEGYLVLEIFGKFDSVSDKSFTSTGQVTQDNPSMVFELDYPYLANEVYSVNVRNGQDGKTISWIPILSTQEISTKTNEEIPFILGQMQSTSVLVSKEGAESFVSLRDENILLSQEIEKKDAIMMEQVMVIQDLAGKISNVKFTKSAALVSLTVAQTESTIPQETFEGYLQTLSEKNNLLTQEIVKKDAIIMEQLKVIQDLVEKVRKVSFESASNFSLV